MSSAHLTLLRSCTIPCASPSFVQMPSQSCSAQRRCGGIALQVATDDHALEGSDLCDIGWCLLDLEQ